VQSGFQWLDDTTFVWPQKNQKGRLDEWRLFDTASGKSRPFFDPSRMIAALEAAGLPPALAKEATRETSFTFDAKKSVVVLEAGADLYTYDFRRNLATRLTSSPAVEKVPAFSPDGRLIAGCGDGKVVKLWDAVTGSEMRSLTGSRSNVYDVAFSRDGHLLAASSQLGEVTVWDTTTGNRLHTFGPSPYLIRAVFSPDGRHIATGAYGDLIRIWDVTTGRETRTFKVATASAVMDRSRARLASTSPRTFVRASQRPRSSATTASCV
jgi:WD40 repeat protein